MPGLEIHQVKKRVEGKYLEWRRAGKVPATKQRTCEPDSVVTLGQNECDEGIPTDSPGRGLVH